MTIRWDPNLNSTSYISLPPLPSLLTPPHRTQLTHSSRYRSIRSKLWSTETLVKMARVAMLLVAMVLVSCSVASAARVLQQGEDVYQEEKFKHGHHDHAKPKLPSLPKPQLPSFTLPSCPPPPVTTDTPTYGSPSTPTDTPAYGSPSTPTYTPSPPPPTYTTPVPPSPPASGY